MWLKSDAKTRLRKFAPGKVRALLEQKGAGPLMHADAKWYSEFCEKYTHVGPGTRPNIHNEASIPVAGAIFQEEGAKTALTELGALLGVLALQICKYFEFDDLYAQMLADVKLMFDADNGT
jgi:hypothetical protein